MVGELSVTVRRERGVVIAEVTGDIDVSTVSGLRERLLGLADSGQPLVVDLNGVSFIDSTGIGVLVGVWRRTKATEGSLALASPSRQAQSVLDATGLTKVLSIYRTEEEAVQACAQPDLPAD